MAASKSKAHRSLTAPPWSHRLCRVGDYTSPTAVAGGVAAGLLPLNGNIRESGVGNTVGIETQRSLLDHKIVVAVGFAGHQRFDHAEPELRETLFRDVYAAFFRLALGRCF